MAVKRIGPVVVLLVMAMPSIAQAQSKADPLEGTLSQKVGKKDPFYGLGMRLGLRMGTGVNMEPEAAHLDLSYQFKLTWKFGKLITKKGWAKLLNFSMRINLNHQPVGSSSLYRTGDTDSNIALNASETLPIADAGGLLQLDNDALARTVDGAPRTARVSDLLFTVAHGKLYKIPKAGIVFNGLVRVMLPTSVRSRSSTMYFALTGALGASRTLSFKAGKVKQSVTLGYTFGISKYFHAWKTSTLDTREDGFTIQGIEVDDPFHGQLTTVNPSYAFSNDFFVTYGFYKGLSLTLSYGLLSYRTYDFDKCEIPYNSADPGVTTNVCNTAEELIDGYEPVGWRDFHGFSASLSYSPLPYLGLQLVMATQTPQRKPSTTAFYQPFFQTNRNGYTSIMLTAYLTLEKLYTTLTGKAVKAAKTAEKGSQKPSPSTASR
jgi:hypothetical protein